MQVRVTNDYKTLIDKKMCHTVPLQDGCTYFKMGKDRGGKKGTQMANHNKGWKTCNGCMVYVTKQCYTRNEFSCESSIAFFVIHAMSLTKQLKCRKWVHNGSNIHNLAEVLTWQYMETARLHMDHYAPDGETFLHWIVMVDEMWSHSYESEFNRHLREKHHQGTSHAKKCCLKLQRHFLACAALPGTVVNTMHYQNSWNTISTLHWIESGHIFCSQAILCCITMLTVMLPRYDCFVQTVKYTILATYEPVWLWPLMETERTPLRHRIQDDGTDNNGGRKGITGMNTKGHGWWHQM
jgi:hypothetical protein